MLKNREVIYINVALQSKHRYSSTQLHNLKKKLSLTWLKITRKYF